ncbi:hypothetical protein [Pseudomonas mangiferae]|uniref:Uncharacterized protein n=1 Tax=Pseudomonas mangiferae TaxID=2593654 RepID=A0A553H4I2_9PSED|nr:hypothetical protein [Pseudomonas mangiferae]TRX76668.1 hypothetical protein FM069_01200 [Pseudomonas mangiferae]
MLISRMIIFSSLWLTASGQVNGENLQADFFEGRYQGQGRGCGGVLTIRHQSISWHSQALNCEIKNYEVTEQEHRGYSHRIFYLVQKKNKSCRLHALELIHDEYFPNYVGGWYANAYLSKNEYDRRIEKTSSYGCVFIKKLNPRNNPEPTDLPNSK